MKVVDIHRESDLAELRADWNGLLSASRSNTIFLTWEWLTAWWSAYGRVGDLRILAVRDDSGVLRAILPLRRDTMQRYGQQVPVLSFVGDGSNDSDYLDFIVAPGYETEVMETLGSYWRDALDSGTVLALNEIPDSSPNLENLRTFSQAKDLLFTETDVPCGVVGLPPTWEEYLNILRPRFRTKIRSVLRNIESRADVRFGFCETTAEVDRLLPVLFDLHTKRWAENGKPGVFGWLEKREFYATLSRLLVERGWLRFSWLEWNGKVLACQYGFSYAGTYFQLQEGYEPASEHWNPGIALRAWSIRELIRQGIHTYDFLGGVGRHKTDWGATVSHSKRLLLARPTYKNRVFCHGPEWDRQAREFVKAWIPEKLVAARSERLQAKAPASVAESVNGSGHPAANGWLQDAAAQCYLKLRFPALLRQVRQRYQVSLSHAGRWPSLRCDRRKQPSGRILYYHRVNDLNDPFFPAHSVAVFERHMRFLSRYYTVVSLAEMLDRLENGTPDNLVAITFDDGYEDNYQNAFPILERYGLPATIFLSTGSIDSREPLWFEQLAHALKTTTKDTIDLEIDVPRRFALGTEAERLAANAQIFAVLRKLQDSDRQRWLADILERLGVPVHLQPAGKMLTWDQVRTMNRHKIDFGGHTVTHPFMSKLARAQAEWQVSECKRRIECELQRSVDYFAYPNGREEDFTDWNKELIRLAGYRGALTTIWGANDRGTDRMELRRGGPWEDNLAVFAYKLDWYELTNG